MAGYIGSATSVVSSGAEHKKTFTITGATTSLTGLNYTVGKVHVFQNGVRLVDGTDYTATNGTTITLTVAAQNGDNVVVISQASYQVALSGIDDQSNATALTIDSSENVLANTTSTSVIGNGGFAIKPQTGNGTRVDISNDGEAMLLDGAASGPIIGLYGNGTSVGSIGTNANGNFQLYGSVVSHVGLQFGSPSILPINNSGASADNAVDLGDSNVRFKDAYLSGGIYLGGAVAANKLDDYEEGTWTPTAVGGVTSFNIVGATYTKVGRNVSIAVYLTGQSGKSANMLQIGGLPFTPMSENYNIGPMDGTGSGRQGFARTNHSSTTINCYYTNSTSGVRQNLNGNDTSDHILFGLTYQTT
jgi:hypothetical protein